MTTDPTPVAADVATAVAAEVTRMLTAAIAAYHRDEAGARVFSLEEAAERLHMSAQKLTIECRAGKVAHTRIGKFRGLTAEQIVRYAAQHTVFDDATPSTPASDVAAAIAMSQRSGGARRGRGQAA
jgi:hypothetical protein